MNRLQRWQRNRRLDREERAIRRGTTGGLCYMCSLSGWSEKATHGDLCERHFHEVIFPQAMNYPDY